MILAVIPAQAGIQTESRTTWIPACAGMTGFTYVE
jgi:hypothetical protein